jgi:fucose permease
MAQISLAETNINLSQSPPKQRCAFTLISLSCVFFMWGFVCALNATLISYLTGIFALKYALVNLTQFCFFAAYLIISDPLAMWSILLMGLFNSIMFPTIFSLRLFGLGGTTSQCFGLLCLAIGGGAILPVIQSLLADKIDLQVSFVLPLLCYLYIAYFGVYGSTPRSNIIQSKLSGVLL